MMHYFRFQKRLYNPALNASDLCKKYDSGISAAEHECFTCYKCLNFGSPVVEPTNHPPPVVKSSYITCFIFTRSEGSILWYISSRILLP